MIALKASKHVKSFMLNKSQGKKAQASLKDYKDCTDLIFKLLYSEVAEKKHNLANNTITYIYGVYQMLNSTIEFFLKLSDLNRGLKNKMKPFSELIEDIVICRIIALTKLSVLDKGLFQCVQRRKTQLESNAKNTTESTSQLEEYRPEGIGIKYLSSINMPDSKIKILQDFIEADSSRSNDPNAPRKKNKKISTKIFIELLKEISCCFQ